VFDSRESAGILSAMKSLSDLSVVELRRALALKEQTLILNPSACHKGSPKCFSGSLVRSSGFHCVSKLILPISSTAP
jgi:hypothetical protein